MICKYVIKNPSIIIEGSTEMISLDERFIKNITLEKDFDKYFLPVFHIEVAMQYELYDEMMNATKANFKLELLMESEGGFKDRKFEGTFDIFISDITTKEQYQEEDNENLIVVNMPLMIEGHAHRYRKHLNAITSGSPLQALGYCLSERNMSNVVLGTPHVTSSSEDIIITPGTLIRDVRILQNTCGLYKNGYILFQDWDRLYLMDKKDLVSIEDEIDTIYVNISEGKTQKPAIGSTVSSEAGSMIMDLSMAEVSMGNPNIFDKELNGDGIVIKNLNTGELIKKEFDVESVNNDVTNYKFYETYASNNVLTEAIGYETYKNNKVIMLDFQSIDFMELKPNRTFVLWFENPKLNSLHGGEYTLSVMMSKLELDGASKYVNYTTCIVKKK